MSNNIDQEDNSNITLPAIINRCVANLINSSDEKISSYVKNPSINSLIHIAHELIKTEFSQGSLTLNDKEHILSEVLKVIVQNYAGNNKELLEFIDQTIVPTLLHLLEGIYNCISKVEDCVVQQTKECCKDKCMRLWRWCCCGRSK